MCKIIRFAILGATVLLILGCSSKSEETSANNVEKDLSLSEPTETHMLKDDLELLDDIRTVQPISGDQLIIVDGKPGIYLFENYKMTTRIGTKGNGPCEYEGISSIDISGDTLFVLSPNQNKITSYSISNNECLGEISNEKLSSKAYMYRNGDHFILGSAANAYTPDSAAVMHRFNGDRSLQPLNLTAGELNRVEAPISISRAGLNFGVKENLLFSYFPLTTKLFIWDLDNKSGQSFPLNLDIKREEIKAAGDDMNRIMELIQSDFHLVTNIITTTENVGVVHHGYDEDGDYKILLQLYNIDGTLQRRFTSEHSMMAFYNGQFIELRETTDPNTEYTYEIAYRALEGE